MVFEIEDWYLSCEGRHLEARSLWWNLMYGGIIIIVIVIIIIIIIIIIVIVQYSFVP